MIIGICGLISSGKSTVANYLIDSYDFRQYSFASPLKDAISIIFGWDRKMLEGDTTESREWREQIDEWWAKRLGVPHLTPRWVLQYWGTEVCRQGFHKDIWVSSVENRLMNLNENIVISDCRFPNELTTLRQLGGNIIRVKRGDDPKWFDTAITANYGNETEQRRAKSILDSADIHASEYSWVGFNFDAVIDNDSTIDELHEKVKDLVSNLPASR